MLPIGTLSMLKITHVCQGPGKISTFSHYWQEVNNALLTSTHLNEVCNYFHAQVGALWAALSNPVYVMQITKGVFLKADEYLDGVSDTGPIPGDASGDTAPFSEAMGGDIAYLMQRRTGKRGRRYRGRMFIPGVDETLHERGFAEGAGVTALEALAAWLGTNRTIDMEDETSYEFAGRHWTPDQKDAEGEITAARDFVVVTDFRWVDKLSTRKDRIHKSVAIAH
jgi:hypothetical protein